MPALLVLLLAACGSEPTVPPTTTPGAPMAAHAEATEGRFRLIFEMPRTTWSTSEAIEGAASLELLGAGAVDLGGSGGGLSGDDPDAAFDEAFFRDPLVHLPPGWWRIAAVASFSEGRDCSGASRNLQAQILIVVTP